MLLSTPELLLSNPQTPGVKYVVHDPLTGFDPAGRQLAPQSEPQSALGQHQAFKIQKYSKYSTAGMSIFDIQSLARTQNKDIV